MDITVLGSSGNTPTPMPTCDCRVCKEAREKGIPYARQGNSLFAHDENILVDTPELVWQSLNRERIEQVDYLFLSHFHADHTLGLRALQSIAMESVPVTDFVGEKPTLVLSPETYERAIEENVVFEHLTDIWAEITVLEEDESIQIGDLQVTHIAAEIERGGGKAISGFSCLTRSQLSSSPPTRTDTSNWTAFQNSISGSRRRDTFGKALRAIHSSHSRPRRVDWHTR